MQCCESPPMCILTVPYNKLTDFHNTNCETKPIFALWENDFIFYIVFCAYYAR